MAMFPVANTVATVTQPPPLVATPLPESISTQRVPFDNVAPSFSSAQVYNNARGNGAIPTPAEAAPAPAVSSLSPTASAVTSPASSVGAPATFLAQLIGQSLPSSSTAASSFLAQYEQMVINSYVKYGNSYATFPRPVAEPSPYDKFVEQQRAAQPAPQPAAQPQPQPAAAQQAPPPQAAPFIAAAPVVEKPAAEPQAKPQPFTRKHQDTIKLAAAPATAPKLAAGAYQASAARLGDATANAVTA